MVNAFCVLSRKSWPLPADWVVCPPFLFCIGIAEIKFFKTNKFIYLFLAVLGLRCGELGLLFIAVHRLLIAVASLVVEHGL